MRPSARVASAIVSVAAVACSSSPDEGGGGFGGATDGGGGAEQGSTDDGIGGDDLGLDDGAPTGDVKGAVAKYTFAFDIDTAAAKSLLDVDVSPPGGACFGAALFVPVEESTWNGAPASAQVDGASWRVCGKPVAGGAALAVGTRQALSETKYLQGLDVGFSRRTDLAGGTFSYLLSWIRGCPLFGPCDPDPSRLARFRFDVTHASGTTVLCPGQRLAAAGKTSCAIDGTLAPTYSAFAVMADDKWQAAPFVSAAGIDVVFYEAPGGQIAASLDKASVAEFLSWITGLLGPMPYGKELRFAGGHTAWLGFEHPANIVLRDDMPALKTSYANATMHVVMHEVVHQWAGDRTTLATAEDFVWKEATAEYLAYVFEDEKRPAGEAAATRAYWDTVALKAQHYPRPKDQPPPPVQTFYGDVYGPGPMVLYLQLETMLGRAVVLKAIQAFLSQPAARSVEDLRAALETASGKSLGPYFGAWVFGSGVPEWPGFDIGTQQSGSEATVTVTQKNGSGKLYGCRLDVKVTGATSSATATVDFGLDPKSATATAKMTLAEPVKATTIDPDHRVVGRDLGAPAAAADLPVWIF